MAESSGCTFLHTRNPISNSNSISDRQAKLLDLHNRLMSDDPVVTEQMFRILASELEGHLRMQFRSLGVGVDPDIYLSAVFDALTDYFKNPGKYNPDKRGLMGYLKMASRRDMQNLLRKESRHAAGRVSLEGVEFRQSDGNDVSERVAEDIDGRRMIEDLRQGMTSEERAIFELMLDGERSTEVAADAMNIGHLPPGEQAREVKRVKDRIKKRIQRRGTIRI